MNAFLASLISVTIVNALALYATKLILKLKDRINSNKFIGALVIATVAFLIYSYISVNILKLSQALDGILSIIVFLVISYFIGKSYLRFDEGLSRKFAVVFTIIATVIGIVVGIALTSILLGMLSNLRG